MRWRHGVRALLESSGRYLVAHQTPVLDDLKFQVGSLHARLVRGQRFDRISEAEFQVFSQFGEDGIIQYLVEQVPMAREIFVEIGVGNYAECNTRFLLAHDNWRGVVFDLGSSHLDFINSQPLAWRHTIDAYQAEVTPANVNELLNEAGVTGDVGLLSIDIDGNDYWVLKDLSDLSPRIIVAEYNSALGHAPIAVPYKPGFDRTAAHYSGTYLGASLAALHHLLSDREYRLVGSNTTGHNAFFVRNDVAGDLPDLTPEGAYIRSLLRDTRDEAGHLTYLDHHTEGLSLIADLPVVNVITGDVGPVKDLAV